jgi:hypothetical protein
MAGGGKTAPGFGSFNSGLSPLPPPPPAAAATPLSPAAPPPAFCADGARGAAQAMSRT